MFWPCTGALHVFYIEHAVEPEHAAFGQPPILLVDCTSCVEMEMKMNKIIEN